MVNKIDNFDKFETTENQAAAIYNHKLDEFDVEEINEERNTLARSIREAAEFNNDEKQNYFETLSSEIDDTDLSAVRQFKTNIERDRTSVRGMIEAYTGMINKNRDAFGVDKNRGLNAADQYIEEFMQLDMQGKQEWLNLLESDITERLELLRRAKEMMPDQGEYLHTLRRSEVKKLVIEKEKSSQNINRAKKIFTENSSAFSKEEQEDIMEELKDSPRHNQATLLNQLHNELKERKDIAGEYEKLPKEYKAYAPDFEKLSFDERQTSMAKIEVQVTKDYRDLQRNHKLAKHVSEDGKDAAYKYFRGLSLTEKVAALGMIDAQFEMEKELSDEFEKLLKEYGKKAEKGEIERIKHEFYTADYQTKEEEKIPQLKTKLEKQKETKEENELTESYTEKLDDAVKKGYIRKKTKELSLKKWNKNGIDYKRKTNDDFDSLLAPYIALFERFEALPESVKKENKEFYESGYDDKLRLISELEEDMELDENLNKKDEKNPNNIEKAEKISQRRLQQLTQMATTAEREEDFEKAYEYYAAILEMDPDDVIAAGRINFVKSRMDETPANDNNKTEKSGKDMLSEAMRNQDINREREIYTVLKESAEETKASERQHGTIDASKRQKDVGNKEIAEALEKYSEGTAVLNKEGESEDILEINIDEQLSSQRLAELKRPVVSDILKSSDPTAMKSIQFKNANGQKLSATEGAKKADKVEEKIKKTLADKVINIANRRKKTINRAELEEDLEKQDFEKLDMTG